MTPAGWSAPPRIESPTSTTPSDHAEVAYTVRYARLGALTSLIGALNALVYVSLTDGPRRPLLIVLTSLGTLVAVVAAVSIRYVVGGRWEMAWFGGFSGSVLVLITVGAAADGGSASPISVLLILPVVYASIAYPLAAVATIAVCAQAAMLLLMWAGHDLQPDEWHRFVVVVAFNILAVASAINRSTYHESARDLATRATHDDLTGCLSYGAFNTRVRAEVARAQRGGLPCSLLIMDIDHFKSINDSHGHLAGDDVLRATARVLLGRSRATDAVGRLGGDEFGVLLADTSSVDALQQSERLRADLRALGDVPPFTVSIGVSTWNGVTDTPADLARRADRALYAAKVAGRDRSASLAG